MLRRKFLKSFAALGVWTSDIVKASARLAPGSATESPGAALPPVELTCEYAANPLGLDVLTPRLSWRLESPRRAQMQSAYQILVATTRQNLNAHRGDLWDSGKVGSGGSIQLEYQGRQLQSFERCHWKVRVWDEAGNSSEYSAPATWEMGVLDDRAWQAAQWVSTAYLVSPPPPAGNLAAQGLPENPHRAPLLRKGFRLREAPVRARAYVCGLGYYELHLNGAKVGDHVLDPAQTDYDQRVFYAAYDVTQSLKAGDNAVGVILGSGWFNQDVVWKTGKYSVPGGTDYGVPRLLFQLRVEYQDGTVATMVSDESWKTAPGPILENNVYGGEFYDARLESPGWSEGGFDGHAWENACPIAAPAGRLRSQNLPPIKAVKTLPAVGMTEVRPGVYVYDFGQNIAGWAKLRVHAPRGTKIILRFAESVFADGRIDPASTGVFATRLVQTDTYIAKGSGEEVWEPRFTYHAFRYAEMRGFPGTPARENLVAVVVHTAVREAGQFECSDALLNRIHRTALWTEIGNLHGVPTDCPGREKCGWLGDAQVSAEMTIYNFEMARFWRKYVEDIETAQVDGLPAMVAPGKRERERAVPDWGTAVVQIPWYIYVYYADPRILEEHYEAMNRWIDHLQGLASGYIVSQGLGDWCPPGSVEPVETPVPLTSTAYFYLDAKIMSKVAQITGRFDDAARFQALAGKIREAFTRKFFAAATMSYGSQTADSVALRLGLAPANEAEVAAALARDVTERHHSHFSTGITGSRCLYGALAEYGHGDVALTILRQQTYPSIQYLYSLGATTFWETWGEPELDQKHGPRSRNHAMQGGFDAWFYQGLAGICPDPEQPGFKHTILMPQIPPGLTNVRAEYNSVHGKIASEWRVEKDSFHWRVAIPANTRATIHVPCDGTGPITEGGLPVDKLQELSLRRRIPGWAVFEIGSGEYNFASRLGKKWQPPATGISPRPWW